MERHPLKNNIGWPGGGTRWGYGREDMSMTRRGDGGAWSVAPVSWSLTH